MKVKDLGESGVIKLLTDMVTRGRRGPDNAPAHNFKLLVDAGDDTAAWSCGGATELYTTDTAVDGVHFTAATTSWYDLGWKITAANLSDIASMGGLPLYALITLGLPPDTEIEELKSLYQGMVELGNEHGMSFVGGDTVRSPVVFVTEALTGICDGDPMLRSTAKGGELVGVTGYLGSSAGGLEIAMKHLPVHGEAAQYLMAAHSRPEPCIPQGRVLSRHGIRTAMDISDGLIEDLSKLCQSSGVAARLESDKIPIHPLLKEMFPERYMDMALGGGEDYQLLFMAPGPLMEQVLPMLPPPATVIGEITEGEIGQVEVVDSKTGECLNISHGGWDHFRSGLSEAEG